MMTLKDRLKSSKTVLIVLGALVVISLFIINSYWHPFWRYQAGYVSQAQFGADWPFTFKDAKVTCMGPGELLLETRAGVFGLTSGALRMGYTSLEDADIWKFDPNGWNNRVPADKFWLYVNTLCK